jgi:hypothetical protein
MPKPKLSTKKAAVAARKRYAERVAKGLCGNCGRKSKAKACKVCRVAGSLRFAKRALARKTANKCARHDIDISKTPCSGCRKEYTAKKPVTDERRKKGLCPRCGNEAGPYVYCADCRGYFRQRMEISRAA